MQALQRRGGEGTGGERREGEGVGSCEQRRRQKRGAGRGAPTLATAGARGEERGGAGGGVVSGGGKGRGGFSPCFSSTRSSYKLRAARCLPRGGVSVCASVSVRV